MYYNIKIKKIITDSEIKKSVKVIQRSFKTVTAELCLNKSNCPTHASFITFEKLKQLKEKKIQFYGLFIDTEQIGFAALEKANDKLYYLEKLAVLPEYRHNGYGKKLMVFAETEVKKQGGQIISIGIIDKHIVLKNWYKRLGFVEIKKQDFAQLPFRVCFMEKKLLSKP